MDPSEYSLRIHYLFETTTGKYDFLNRMIAVGTGRKTDAGISYQVYEIR